MSQGPSVLVTCPPMLRAMDEFGPRFAAAGVQTHTPAVVQTLSVDELVGLVPRFDGWIIGDDPANARVFEAGVAGRLRAAVKWGVGVDNVDFAAAKRLGLPIVNTPGMFGAEVADVAVGYVIALARHLVAIDRGVRAGGWPKPRGTSLRGKTAAVVGMGDIGSHAARRLLAFEMRVVGYDPHIAPERVPAGVTLAPWPSRLDEADFIVFTCALTLETRHMLSAEVLERVKRGVRIVNVARGPLLDEPALVAALEQGRVAAAALDVFEDEPLPAGSPLRRMEQCILGSHNGSNTEEAVRRTSERAIELLFGMLGVMR